MITRWVIFNIYKKHKKEYVGVIDKKQRIFFIDDVNEVVVEY